MILLPNYMKEESDVKNKVSSMRSDIYYSKKYLVVSKKKLIHNFTDNSAPTYVRLLYVYTHNIPEKYLNEDVLEKYKDFHVDLNYVLTGMYDDNPYHLFGNIIYNEKYPRFYEPRYSYTNMQSVNQIFKEYETGDQIIKNQANAMYLGLNILKDEIFITNPNPKAIYHSFDSSELSSLSFSKRNLCLKDVIDCRNNVKISNINLFENEIISSKKDINNFEVLYITDLLNHLAIDLLTPEMCTCIDKITFISDGENITIRNVEYPFNKIDKSYIEKIVLVYKYHIYKSVEKISNSFVATKLMCHINPMYTLFWLKATMDTGTQYFIKECLTKNKIIEMSILQDKTF